MSLLSFIGAVAIGLSLGLTGAGGSVITLPVLVYLADIRPSEAVGISLFVVGASAGVGALQRIRAGEFHGRAAFVFAAAGALGAVGGSKLTPLVPDRILMLIFAILMLLVAAVMLFGGRGEHGLGEAQCRPLRCLGAGFGVGVLTGFIGVGGGFLLVPSLMHFARLPMRVAIGTSLVIVTANSLIGFLSHLGGEHRHWGLAVMFAVVAVAGVMIGHASAARLPAARLRQIFAFVVLATGIYVLGQTLL